MTSSMILALRSLQERARPFIEKLPLGVRQYLRRWGALLILLGLWASSWIGHYHFERIDAKHDAEDHKVEYVEDDFRAEWWAGTFENLQSEWAQLFVQGALIVGAARIMFRKSVEDMDEVQRKIDDARIGMIREIREAIEDLKAAS